MTERLNVSNGIYSLGGHFHRIRSSISRSETAPPASPRLGVPNLCDPLHTIASQANSFSDYAKARFRRT